MKICLKQLQGACAYGIVPLLSSLKCCRSTVVVHSLGKGEVVSSILTGSTSIEP